MFQINVARQSQLRMNLKVNLSCCKGQVLLLQKHKRGCNTKDFKVKPASIAKNNMRKDMRGIITKLK